MKILISLICALLFSFGHLHGAAAQPADYPNRTVRIVSPYPPGGPADLVARAIAERLTEIVHQPVIVESRPGAGGTTGTAYVAMSKPDGYTLLLGGSSNSIAPFLFPNLPFDTFKDLVPLGMVGSSDFFLIVNKNVPVNTIAELIALAKTKPGQLKFGSPGVGTTPHMAGELLNAQAGIKLTHVPYQGLAPAYVDVLGGNIDMVFLAGSGSGAAQDVKDGKVKAIASAGRKRSPTFPDSPKMSEAGLPEVEVFTWYGLMAAAGTPQPIVDYLAAALKEVSGHPTFAKQMGAMGFSVDSATPAELADLMRKEGSRYGPIINATVKKD